MWLATSFVARAIASPAPLVPPTRRDDSTPCAIGEANDVTNPRTAFLRHIVDALTYSQHDRVPTPAGPPPPPFQSGHHRRRRGWSLRLNINYDIDETLERIGRRVYILHFFGE